MKTEIADKQKVLQGINEVVAELDDLMASLNEHQINKIPYEDSWTAGQLFRHVSKSTNAMAKALKQQGEAADRETDERVPELKKTFLDFLHKMKSPDIIVPDEQHYEKQSIVNELNAAIKSFDESAATVNANELIHGLPLGPITKLEIIHFTWYHTQRHLHQMRKICKAVK